MVSEGNPRSAKELTLTLSDNAVLMRTEFRAAAPRKILERTNKREFSMASLISKTVFF
jgi:hypothetical protein